MVEKFFVLTFTHTKSLVYRVCVFRWTTANGDIKFLLGLPKSINPKSIWIDKMNTKFYFKGHRRLYKTFSRH